MLKETSIQKLIYENAVPELDIVLKPQGFKYLKSKSYFVKQNGIFQHIIYVSHPTSALDYDESRDLTIVKFTISGAIKIPDFEKWCFEKFNEQIWYCYDTQTIASTIDFEIDELYDSLGEDSFYTPTPSREFKRKVTLYYVGNSENYATVSLGELLNKQIPLFLKELEEMSDLIKLFEAREYSTSLSHILLLVFGGYTDLAKEHFDKAYQEHLNYIENNLKTNPRSVRDNIKNLEKFIEVAQKVINTSYENPYGKAVKILSNQNIVFKFSEKTIFKESLRIDVSQFEINSYYINSIGEILLIINQQKIIKLAKNGTVLIEKEVENIEGFVAFHTVLGGIIEQTDEFYVNNCILRKDNSITVLNLPKVEKKNEKSRRITFITDFKFSNDTNEYLVLYRNVLLFYDIVGNLKKNVHIDEEYCSKIVIEKQHVVSHIGEDEKSSIYDFNAKLIQRYECHNALFSDDFTYAIDSINNKTKLYNLIDGKKTTLWAHPTFIKGYKEIIFKDTWRNTSVKQIKFSPDNQYIIAIAGQGKYVAWRLPKLERVELLPKAEFIDLLPGITKTIFSDKGAEELVVKPQLVEIEGQVYFKNTRDDLANVFFFEGGNLFLIVVDNYYSPFALLWDKNFNNLSHYKMSGKVVLHGNKYLSEKSIKEFVVYIRDNE